MSFRSKSYSTSSAKSNAIDGADVRTLSEDCYKLVLVGDSGVGKSCLLEKLLDQSSKNTFISTIGVVIRSHTFVIGGQSVKLQVWDTGGQQRYRPVLSTCYRNAFGVVVVYDVTNPTSFLNLAQWLNEITEYSNESIPKMLIGNKSDLSHRRKVSVEEARKFADKFGMSYVETSALDSVNIAEAFTSLILKDARLSK